MRRPLSDFFEKNQILNARLMLHSVGTYCYICEELLGDSHYHIGTQYNGHTMLVCCPCMGKARHEIIQARQGAPMPSRHFTPLTSDEESMPPSFKRLRPLKKG